MPAAASGVERLLLPFDGVRRLLLRALGPFLGTWASRRDVRVATLGTVAVLTALAGTVFFPLWLLALGPIVLGVPHLLSDVRYLVARPGLHRRGAAMLAPVAALLVAGATARLSWGLVAALAAALVARGGLGRKLVALAVITPLFALALRFRGWGEFVFAHLHNVIALALWWSWRPRGTGRLALVPLGLFALATSAIALGVLDDAGLVKSTSLLGIPFRAHLFELSPPRAAEWGPRLVLMFAFAQSVHYGVWLRMVPEDDRDRPAPRTFVSSFRALRAELGGVVLAVTATLAVGLALWALFDLRAARAGYLRFAAFHGYLELAAIALFFVEGTRPVASRPQAHVSSRAPLESPG